MNSSRIQYMRSAPSQVALLGFSDLRARFLQIVNLPSRFADPYTVSSARRKASRGIAASAHTMTLRCHLYLRQLLDQVLQ